jgi:hypothetical protein
MKERKMKNSSNLFENIVKEIQETNFIKLECPDQFVGRIKVDKSLIFLESRVNDFLTRQDINYENEIVQNSKIVLILESPHKNEVIFPFGPAKGKTGQNIRLLFAEVFKANLPIGTYDFYIVNAIQYQCSLGFSTKCFRDKVFAKSWECFGKTEFKNRLSKLVSVDDIVINCCTAGNGKIKLRSLVKNALVEMKLKVKKILEFEHPSNWMREKNKAIKNKTAPNYKWKNA